MALGLEFLAEMYPGRFMMLGRNEGGKPTIVYGLTGRKESSRARKIVSSTNTSGRRWSRDERTELHVVSTNEAATRTGNPDYLLYPAVIAGKAGVIVSNGSQTPSVYDAMLRKDPSESSLALAEAQHHLTYERDAENTPRISGAVRYVQSLRSSHYVGVLGIVKKAPFFGDEKQVFEFALTGGCGKFISTYAGDNSSPPPCFEGVPIDVALKGVCAQEVAHHVHESLNKYRISVAAMCIEPEGSLAQHIINDNYP